MVLRVGGLASGMDIESIVKNLMTAERMPLDKLKQQKQTLEWQRDDYRKMNTLLLDFRTELTQMKLTSKYRSSSVTTSDDTKVKATAATSASQASYSISSVSKLAEAENWVTNSIGTVNGTKALSTQLTPGGTPAWDWVPGKVESKTVTSTGGSTVSLGVPNGSIQSDKAADMSIKVNGVTYEMVASIDDLASGENQATIDANGNITFSQSITAGASVKIDYISKAAVGETYANFSITTQTSKDEVKENILFNSSETLNQVVDKVNKSNANVSMFYDTATNRISLMQKETGDFTTGTANNISVVGGFAQSALQFGSAAVTKGSDAEFTINGLTTTRHSNTFDMNGVSITLKKKFTLAEGAASLSVNKDSNAIYDNIKGFIDKYNTLIGAVSSKTSEERYRSYTPLTDDQREQLGDKQQEQWEEKAKSGLLRRDSILTSVVSSMRGNFSQPVSNSETNAMYKQLASIGITTTANYLEGGKLQINEAKLKEAINTNPDAVEALFRGGGDSTSVGEKGIVHRLYDTVNATMDRLKERAGNSFSTNQQFALGRQLSGIDSGIKRFEDRLTQVEDRYWKQFTAMEKAIQNANSQSSYLMQQFSS
ncbi:flagellar filament capping protein FliD [Domibacillus sp. A3M-37]|uniref:flagellar filament capping protein FliD n=1 Tax=Domibacillus sp. A3M-37 TaxID=2962037 RepID=UPI0020B7949A|nr:flagellar filament capping protein FliD [Domibacillus sp. A3M-37]MCP3761195.1 flagellar filament capping protein FliD [Domibacillus sp. A3M-37]